jgi:heterodisulfide reductase subunit A
MGIKFVRGKPSHFTEVPKSKKVTVTVEDTLTRNIIHSDFDLVVLANGMGLSKASEPIADSLKLAKSDDGFFKEAHPKYRPVDTLVEGVFLAGTAQGPKDIPDTVTQASAAAGRVLATLAQKEFTIDPTLAFIHQDICDGCKACLSVCPKQAISLNENGKAEVNEALCLGCGSCISSCHVEAIDLNYYTNKQMYAQIAASLRFKKPNEKRILIFADDNTVYRLADACGVRKMKYSTDTRIFRVPSGSRITEQLMLFAFTKGADAILIGDSPEKGSRFAWANTVTNENITKVQNKLADLMIDANRVDFKQYSAGDLAKFVADVDGIADKLNMMEKITDEARKELLASK